MADADMEQNNKNRIVVCRYFEKTLHNNEIKGICKREKRKMCIKCAYGSTSTLLNCMLLCHCAQHDEMLADEKKHKNEKEVR